MSGPVARAARQGGVLIAVTGNRTNYRFPYYWSSADGISFGTGDYMSSTLDDAVVGIDAECLGQPVALLHARYGTGPRLVRQAPGNWISLDGPPGWPNGNAAATVLADGRTYWAFTQNNQAVTQHSVTMRGSP